MNKKWLNSLLASVMAISSFTVTNVSATEAQPTNLAIGGTIEASNEESSNGSIPFPKENVIDGDPTSHWGSSQGHINGILKVTLKDGQAQLVKRIKITFEDRSPGENAPGVQTNITHYQLWAYKNGNAEPEKIYEKNSGVQGVEDITLDQSVNTNKIELRIMGIQPTGWQNNGVAEIEVYADEDIINSADNHMKGSADSVTVSSTEGSWTKDKLYDGIQTNGVTSQDLTTGKQNRWASAPTENTQAWVKKVFPKTTQVQEVYVNFFRDVKPMNTQVSAFDIVYLDQNDQEHTVTVNNTLVEGLTGDEQGYEDRVTYQFASPVYMKEMTIKNFQVKECQWNNISIEEIEIYSNKRGEVTPPEVEVEQTPDKNHLKESCQSISASSYETGTTYTADKLNNGNLNDRWATNKATAQRPVEKEWISATFKKPTKIQELDFYFANRGSDTPNPSNIQSFDVVFTTADGETVKHVDNTVDGEGFAETYKLVLDEAVVATKVEIKNFVTKKGGWDNLSIREIEAYSNEQPVRQTLDSVVSSIQGHEIPKGKQTLDLPVIPDGFTVEFNGCDLEQIIDAERNVHTPLVDKVVNVNWNVSDSNGNVKNTGDLKYTVKGEHSTQTVNAKPVVIPEIQEWHSTSNKKLVENSLNTVVYSDDSLKAIVDEFVKDYADFTGKTLTVKKGNTSKAGAIFVQKDASVNYLGKEGYAMDIQEDRIVIQSNDIAGNMYGMQTILQMYKQDASGYPVGMMHDYPRFPVRGLLLDVARKPVSLEMMKEITRSMRYYKMNDFQAHLSDNYIFLEDYANNASEEENALNAYEAFRLETSLTNAQGESPTAKDYFFTKDEFRSFIQDERALGMNIVPEIDVPAHSTAFTKVWPEFALKGKNPLSPEGKYRSLIDHLNITDERAKQLILDIFADYTTGDNPVFDSETTVHVGADEFLYDRDYDSYRRWLNEYIPAVKAQNNNTIRMWGGLTWIKGPTQIKDEAIENVQMNIWSLGWAKGKEMYDMGYKLIHTLDNPSYMVPSGNRNRGGYGDYLNLNNIFDNYECNKFEVTLPSGDDQILGGAYAIWNDNIDKKASGLTESDIYDRFFDALPLYAEKTWAATGKEKGSVQNITNIAKQKGTGPNTNPYYQAELDKNGNVMKYDFNSLNDLSENKNNLAIGENAKVENGALTLGDNVSYVTTPIEQLGNGNALTFDITLSSEAKPGDIIFEETSPYGKHDIRIMDDGVLGFTRELYEYRFGNYKLPVNEKVNIRIEVESQATKLYVNDEFVADATGQFVHNGTVKKSGITNATFALPLERIGSKENSIAATIDNVGVYSTDKGLVSKENWTGNAESENAPNQLFKFAFDNDPSTFWHSSWQGQEDKIPSDTNPNGSGLGRDGLEAVIHFDRGIYTDNFSFTPRQDMENGRVTEASLYVNTSSDKNNPVWELVADKQKFANDALIKTFRFGAREIYGVKFVATKSNTGHVCISEFDVREITIVKDELEALLNEQLDLTNYTVDSVNAYNEAKAKGQEVFDNPKATQKDVDDALKAIQDAKLALVDLSPLKTAIDAGKQIKDLDKYTAESAKALTDAISAGEAVLAKSNASTDDVASATKAINDAIAKLTLKPTPEPEKPNPNPNPDPDPEQKPDPEQTVVDKTELEALIKKALEIKADGYTKESYQLLQDTIASANEVVGNANATSEQVTSMIKTLQAAIDGLKKVELNEEGSQQDQQSPTTPSTSDNTKITGIIATLGLATAGIYVSMKKKKED